MLYSSWRFTRKLQSQWCINYCSCCIQSKFCIFLIFYENANFSIPYAAMTQSVKPFKQFKIFFPLDEGLNLGLRYKNFFCIMLRPQKEFIFFSYVGHTHLNNLHTTARNIVIQLSQKLLSLFSKLFPDRLQFSVHVKQTLNASLCQKQNEKLHIFLFHKEQLIGVKIWVASCIHTLKPGRWC